MTIGKYITKEELKYAHEQLKPVERKTITGKKVKLDLDKAVNVAKILEVTREAVYLIEKKYEKAKVQRNRI